MTALRSPDSAVDNLRMILHDVFAGRPGAQQLLDDVTRELTGRVVVHPDQDLRPRRFVLRRRTDVSGVSGTGDVADGVLWPDGTAAVRWRGEHPSTVVWDRGQASVELIHGHQGSTTIEWLDDETGAAIPVPTDEQPLALRRAVDRAMFTDPPCPSCGRKTACPCGVSRHDARVDSVLAAVVRWLPAQRSEAG